MSSLTSIVRPKAPWFFVLALAGVVLFALACGGGDDNGNGGTSGGPADTEPIGQAEASTAANQFLTTTLGLFTGSTDVDEFVGLFAPECRDEADTESLELVLLFIRGFAADLQGIEIEEVDAGELRLEETPEGTRVTPVDPDALRVKVDGEFRPASEFFAEAGFNQVEDQAVVDSVLLVRRDGEIRLGDCSMLTDISGAMDS